VFAAARRRFGRDPASVRTSVVRSVLPRVRRGLVAFPAPAVREISALVRVGAEISRSGGVCGPSAHVSGDSCSAMTGTLTEQAGDWGSGGAACLRSVSGSSWRMQRIGGLVLGSRRESRVFCGGTDAQVAHFRRSFWWAGEHRNRSRTRGSLDASVNLARASSEAQARRNEHRCRRWRDQSRFRDVAPQQVFPSVRE
jgi:hypothetical protein